MSILAILYLKNITYKSADTFSTGSVVTANRLCLH